MSETIYCKPTDPTVESLIRKTFGALTLKQVAVSIHEQGGMSLTSYWSGGTRDYHKIVRLEDMEVFTVPENGSGFTAVDRAFGPAGMPIEMPAPGFVVVTHTTGSYCALRVSIHRENAAKMLPAPVELTWAEKVVLVATRSLKSSYAGKSRAQAASEETGITLAEYDTAKAGLITRGFLNKAGAITIEGRNAAGTGDLYRLRNRGVAA